VTEGPAEGRPPPGTGQKLLIALGATAMNAVLYLVPNHLQLFPARQLWWTTVDGAVPFLPGTVWIYFSDYVLVAAAFLLQTSWPEVRRYVKTYFVLLVVGAVIHLSWPTVFPRDGFPLDGATFSARALATLRGVDAATSCLPSMHVAGSYLAAFSLWRHRPVVFGGFLLWATAVAVSTLTTKQHYLVDIFAGLLLALAIATVFFWIPGPRSAQRSGWATASSAR
jgi:membrane-associated phospholipid phosphatase